jgi:excisionase family DNA binding protein
MKTLYVAEKEELQQLIKECIHEEIQVILQSINQKTLPERLSLVEAAQYLGVSKSTMYGYTCARKIPYYKFGKRVYFYTKELEECIRNSSLRHKSSVEIANEASEYLSNAARKKLSRR